MLLFKRLFNFDPPAVAELEHRLSARYAPGAGFPLQAWFCPPRGEWPARVLNLSADGVAVTVDPAAQPVAGERCKLRLALGDFRQDFDARIAHSRPDGRVIHCGVAMDFADFAARKAYFQVLQPVTIGCSLQAVPDERVIQNEPQFIKRVFRGDEGAVLAIWLQKTFGTPLHSFEFQLQNYFCHADVTSGVLEMYSVETDATHKGKLSQPMLDTSPALRAEIRQLFRWVVPNLSTSVPDDVRAVIRRFAE